MDKNSLCLGTRIPPEIKTFSKLIPNISKNAFRLLLQLVVNTISGRPVTDGALLKIQNQVGPIEHIEELYAGISYLVHTFLWNPTGKIKAEVLKEELKELKWNDEFIADLTSVLYGPRRPRLDQALTIKQPHYPYLKHFCWRIDIIISSSYLSRVLEPSLLLEMKMSNGEVCKVRVSVSNFHTLRRSVATVLAEMATLEKRSIFKATTSNA